MLFLVLLIGLLLTYLLVALWPAALSATGTNPSSYSVTLFGGAIQFSLGPDDALLVIVIVVSALGGWVHSAKALAFYIGERELRTTWLWWYFIRVVVGSPLAVIFYFAIRGGVLSTGTTSSDINPYGVAAIAGLVGLFSEAALSKLRDAFAPGASTPEEDHAARQQQRTLFAARPEDKPDTEQ